MAIFDYMARGTRMQGLRITPLNILSVAFLLDIASPLVEYIRTALFVPHLESLSSLHTHTPPK
jgi:hypothetical protein